jgi:hypothetical protein
LRNHILCCAHREVSKQLNIEKKKESAYSWVFAREEGNELVEADHGGQCAQQDLEGIARLDVLLDIKDGLRGGAATPDHVLVHGNLDSRNEFGQELSKKNFKNTKQTEIRF